MRPGVDGTGVGRPGAGRGWDGRGWDAGFTHAKGYCRLTLDGGVE